MAPLFFLHSRVGNTVFENHSKSLIFKTTLCETFFVIFKLCASDQFTRKRTEKFAKERTEKGRS